MRGVNVVNSGRETFLCATPYLSHTQPLSLTHSLALTHTLSHTHRISLSFSLPPSLPLSLADVSRGFNVVNARVECCECWW